ncbi:META domain-containing protein [Chloroflexota bacterium]
MNKVKLLGIVLVLTLMTAMLGACGTTSEENGGIEEPTGQDKEKPETSSLEGTIWILTFYGEQMNLTNVLDGSQITATFSSEGEIRGSAGCNSYFAGYSTESGGITISQIANTEMFCIEPEGVMDQETQYLGILRYAES